MQGRSPKPRRRRPCPAQAGWPHRRTRWEALRHTVSGDDATWRGLIPEGKKGSADPNRNRLAGLSAARCSFGPPANLLRTSLRFIIWRHPRSECRLSIRARPKSCARCGEYLHRCRSAGRCRPMNETRRLTIPRVGIRVWAFLNSKPEGSTADRGRALRVASSAASRSHAGRST